MAEKGLDAQVGQAIASAAPAERFGAALRLVLRHFGAQTGTIHRLDPGDGHLHLVAASEGLPEPVLAVSRRIPLGKGIAGAAAQGRQPVSLCNLQTDQSGVARPGAKATGVHGALCVPVFDGARVVGTLGIGVQGEREFTEAETRELVAAARALAPSLAGAGR